MLPSLAGIIASSASGAGRNLYWVGGSASWNGTAGSKWSLTDGGASGEAEPTSIDNVFFTAVSGAVTVTVATTVPSCRNLDFTGFTGTFAGSTASSIYGNLTLATGMTQSYTGAITFASTATGKTITSNGKSLSSSNITFNGVGGGWTLQDAMTVQGTTLTNGAFNTNGQTFTSTIGISSNNSNVRSLTLGASTVNVASNITFTISTNLTFSAASATINLTNVGIIDLGSTAATIGTLNFTVSSTNISSPSLVNRSASDVTIGTLTRSNASVVNTVLLLSGNFTVTNTISIVGTNVKTGRLAIINANPGLTCQLTATGASKTFTNVDFYGITAVGNTPWTGTSMGNCGGNSGITFDSPVTRYLVTAAGSNTYTGSIWSASSGGATGATQPLPQDTIVIDSSSFASSGRTLTLNGAPATPGFDFTNATNNPAFNPSIQFRCFGDLKFIAGMTTGGNSSILFNKWSGNQTLTTAGVSLAIGIQIITGGTFILADAPTVTSPSGISLASGTFNDGNFDVTINSSSAAFQISFTPLNAPKIFNKGTGTYVLSGIGSWNVIAGSTTNLTFTDSGTVKFTNNSSSTKTFAPGGLTYNNFWNATAGTGVVNMNGASTNSTWNDFKIDAGRTQQFLAGTTTTFATLTSTGTAGNVITIGGSTAANFNMVATGGNVTTDYISISRCQFSGSTWHAGANSTDGGNNSGITFP